MPLFATLEHLLVASCFVHLSTLTRHGASCALIPCVSHALDFITLCFAVAGSESGRLKEYIKSDGRKWYYNVETKKCRKVPEEFEKLDAIAAAAAAKGEARGTQA